MGAVRRVIQPLLPVSRFTRSDRKIVLVIWVAGVVQGFGQSQASASLPFTRAGLGLSDAEMSLLLGIARLAAFAALPLGWLGDHRGRRKPLLLAVTLIVVGGTAAGLVAEAWQFGLAHAVLRTGAAAVSGLAVVILAENTSHPIRAYAISFYGAAVSFGAGLALAALPLADNHPQAWRIPHLLTGAGVLVLPFLIRKVPESVVYVVQSSGGHWRELLAGDWARRFWLVVTISFLAAAYGAVGATFSTERLVTQLGIPPTSTVLIMLGGGTAGGIGFFVGGHMADAWGRRRTSVLSLLLALAGGVTVYTMNLIPLIVAGAVVSAFGTFSYVPAAGSHRAEMFPTSLRSSASTAAANATLAGSAIGLISGIYTISRFGLTGTVLLLGIGVVAAAAMTLLLPETRGQDLTAVRADRL